MLYGGLEAYWNEAGPGAIAGSVGGSVVPVVVPRARPVGPAAPSAGAPLSRPKKKSAWC